MRRRRERGHGEDECVDVSNGRLKLAKKGGVGREQEGGSDLAFEDRIKLGGALLSTISMLAMRESGAERGQYRRRESEREKRESERESRESETTSDLFSKLGCEQGRREKRKGGSVFSFH